MAEMYLELDVKECSSMGVALELAIAHVKESITESKRLKVPEVTERYEKLLDEFCAAKLRLWNVRPLIKKSRGCKYENSN